MGNLSILRGVVLVILIVSLIESFAADTNDSVYSFSSYSVLSVQGTNFFLFGITCFIFPKYYNINI